MKRNLLFFCFAVSSALFFSCEKGSIDATSIEIGINPALDKEGLNRALQLRGRFLDSTMPMRGDSQQYTMTLFQDTNVVDYLLGASTYVPVSIRFNGVPLPPGVATRFFNFQVLGSTGYWKVEKPAGQDNSNGTLAFIVPKLVQPGDFAIRFNAEVIFGGKTYFTETDTAYLTSYPASPCTDSIVGFMGLSVKKFDLGNKKGKFKIRYSTGKDPDRVDVKYGSEFIFTTGTKLPPGHYPNCGSGGMVTTGDGKYKETLPIDYDPALSRFVTVYGFGSCEYENTRWVVYISCPQ